MQSIKQVARLNQLELDNSVPASASWHTDYRDTAYIYIGGIHLDLSEGDVLTIFSQYGEPVWIKLARDKDTGKSRGFAWLKYEDQRSCDLAVDNLSGAEVLGKLLAVDHARYKRRDDENEADGYVGQDRLDHRDEGDQKRRKQDAAASESESEEERPLIKEEVELAKLMQDHDEDDPMKAYMIEQKKEEVAEALKAVVKSGDRKKHREKSHRHRRRRSDEPDARERYTRRRSSSNDGDKHRRRHKPRASSRSRSPDRNGR